MTSSTTPPIPPQAALNLQHYTQTHNWCLGAASLAHCLLSYGVPFAWAYDSCGNPTTVVHDGSQLCLCAASHVKLWDKKQRLKRADKEGVYLHCFTCLRWMDGRGMLMEDIPAVVQQRVEETRAKERAAGRADGVESTQSVQKPSNHELHGDKTTISAPRLTIHGPEVPHNPLQTPKRGPPKAEDQKKAINNIENNIPVHPQSSNQHEKLLISTSAPSSAPNAERSIPTNTEPTTFSRVLRTFDSIVGEYTRVGAHEHRMVMETMYGDEGGDEEGFEEILLADDDRVQDEDGEVEVEVQDEDDEWAFVDRRRLTII